MPLGVPLSTLRRELRAETGTSLNPLQGIAAQQSLDLILDRQQRELWDAYTWRHLRIFRPVTLAAGQAIYSYPEDIPFDQIITMWFAEGLSGRWRPLTYGITLGMVPPSGPMRGTPCRWDNVEVGTGSGPGPDPGPGNTAPTITSDGGGPTAAITIPTSATVVTTVTAFDPDPGQTLSYSIIGGAQASLFTINALTGVLTLIAGGSPGNGGGGPGGVPRAAAGTYNVVVQVSDGAGGTDSQSITVTVSDAGPGGNVAPTIISNGGGAAASVNVAPGNQSVTAVQATDPDAGQTITYSIIGGPHASLFIISPSNGQLSFISTSVAGVYNVIVQASDGHGGTDSQSITVTVGAQPGRRDAVTSFTIVPTNPIGQFTLLPMPASSNMLLRVEGQAAINPLVEDNDRCVIDSRLITLFASAEILANQKSEGAAMKLTKAQNHLRQLLKNQAATKRVNYNMGGSQRFGNDPNKMRAVPYLDYIPS